MVLRSGFVVFKAVQTSGDMGLEENGIFFFGPWDSQSRHVGSPPRTQVTGSVGFTGFYGFMGLEGLWVYGV